MYAIVEFVQVQCNLKHLCGTLILNKVKNLK